MKGKIYKKIFDFEIKNDMKVSITNNEIYNQLFLYIFFSVEQDVVILVPTLNDANKLFNNIKKYVSEVFIFPEDDYITKKAIAASSELLYMRVNFLNSININEKKIVILHVNSFIKKLPKSDEYKSKYIKLKKSLNIVRDELTYKLTESGYRKESLVTNVGEFAVRGFIVDVFPIGEERPVRIDFFDNEIESLSYFDEMSQRTIKSIDEIVVKPVVDDFSKNDSSILDYLSNPLVVVQDENQCNNVMDSLIEQIKYYDGDFSSVFSLKDIEIKNKMYVDLINNNDKYDYVFSASSIQNFNNDYEKFIDYLRRENTFLCSSNSTFIDKIRNNISDVSVIDEEVNSGFVYDGVSYVSQNDLVKSVISENVFSGYKFGKKINDIEKLQVGDYVVHKNHGIGVYMGLKTITKNGVNKDYILIQYHGNDKLYLSIDNVNKLYKYSSREGVKPKINKLNSLEWQKTKIRIKNKIKNITDELLEIYKNRAKVKVEPFLKDEALQEVFESEFPYEFTQDQIKSTLQIKKDLESGSPMDRLLCGDVGYGKTEVIFRVIFKAIMNNKQVMYLCPTTLLSRQQFNSALDRFKNYSVNIALLNRHTTKSEVSKILSDLKSGKIDIIFGTHRLLSGDIVFKDLGLLVIDEEHRFGVMHKEKIKKIKENVHVLNVSATPIPRSLQMSLIGIRDLSLIETPPKNRYPVQTYVISYDKYVLREIVLKEYSRNGQVFILYNKIEDMDAKVNELRAIIPEVKIIYAHGRMDKHQINDVMSKFTLGEYDVLLSTTIIENGIDIPNANTMIVIDADKFGLSQLYQIRGRVGRGDRIAYAYLMYDKGKILGETAVKRLEAIKEFTELGSGYKLSMRDLSIRGAGDILGREQAGFIDSIGVDLYLELVNEEINNIESKNDEVEIILDDVETHIGEVYSDEDDIIIMIHKKITSIKSEEDFKNVYDEVMDRFGVVDEKLEIYMYQELLEVLLSKCEIKININTNSKISFKIDENVYKNLNIEELFVNASKINTKFNFVYRGSIIYIELTKVNLDKHYVYYCTELLKYITKVLGL